MKIFGFKLGDEARSKSTRYKESTFLREAKFKHHLLELCFSKRAKLAEVRREFYAEVQLENVSL